MEGARNSRKPQLSQTKAEDLRRRFLETDCGPSLEVRPLERGAKICKFSRRIKSWLATASASYRIEKKPEIPKLGENRPKIENSYFLPIFTNFPIFLPIFLLFRDFGVFLFCSWPTRSQVLADVLYFFFCSARGFVYGSGNTPRFCY